MLAKLGMLFFLVAGQTTPNQPSTRFGLWEATSTTTPAGMGASSHPERLRECISSNDAFLTQMAGRLAASCTQSNKTDAPGLRSFDVTCPGSKSHVAIQTFSPESSRTTTSIDVIRQGQHVTYTHVLDMHFISASCGTVKPGQPQIIP